MYVLSTGCMHCYSNFVQWSKLKKLICLRLIELQILSDTYTHETTKALQQIK